MFPKFQQQPNWLDVHLFLKSTDIKMDGIDMDRFRFIQIKDCVTKNQETKDIVNEQLDSKSIFPTILPFVHENDVLNLKYWSHLL